MDAAMRLGAEQVEAEHLLLALAEWDGPAARAIAEAGMDPASLAARRASACTRSPRASRRCARPCEPASSSPASEHVLLGLLRPPAPALARVLARQDVEPERLAALVEVEVAAGRR